MTDTPKQPLPSVNGEVVAWRWRQKMAGLPWESWTWIKIEPVWLSSDLFTVEPLVLKSALDASRAETAAAKREADTAYDELSAVSKAVGNVQFMDPPDGGSVSLGEQVNRMRLALDAANARADALERERDEALAEQKKLLLDYGAECDRSQVLAVEVADLRSKLDVARETVTTVTQNTISKEHGRRAEAAESGLAKVEQECGEANKARAIWADNAGQSADEVIRLRAKLAKAVGIADALEFSAENIIAEDDKEDALLMLEAMRRVVIEAASWLRACDPAVLAEISRDEVK